MKVGIVSIFSRIYGLLFSFIQFLRPDVCLGKFVGAVNISVAMNLEDLGISRDLEILAQTPHKFWKKRLLELRQQQTSKRISGRSNKGETF